MSRISRFGLARAAAVFGLGIAFPLLVTPDWLVNIGVFTLMYAGLATAWNLFSGYTGYISLGQAAFFGIGAYTLAITFNHVSIGGGYRPFYVLPLIGIAVGLASVPVALGRAPDAGDDLRDRHADAPLHRPAARLQPALADTTAPRAVAVPQPSFTSNFDRPYYYAMLGILALGMLVTWYVMRQQARAAAPGRARGRGEGARARRPRHRRQADRLGRCTSASPR